MLFADYLVSNQAQIKYLMLADRQWYQVVEIKDAGRIARGERSEAYVMLTVVMPGDHVAMLLTAASDVLGVRSAAVSRSDYKKVVVDEKVVVAENTL